MKGKSLKIIQVIAKICSILSIVGFIGCIVGAAGCLTGLFGVLGVASIGSIHIFGVDGIISDYYSGFSASSTAATLLAASVVCGSMIYPFKKARAYFTHELEEGNPFTRKLAKELRFLGIIFAAFSLGCTITVAIIKAIAHVASGSGNIDVKNSSMIGFGAILVIMSFLCDYGADLRESAGEAAAAETAAQYNVTEPAQQYNVTEPAQESVVEATQETVDEAAADQNPPTEE